MNLTPPKLKPVHIGILAILLAAIVGGAAAYLWIAPLVKSNSATLATVTDLESQGDPANKTRAEKKLADAMQKAAQAHNQWSVAQARYFRVGPKKLPIDLGADLWTAGEQLTLEKRTECAVALTKWVKSTGNTVVVMPEVKGAPEGPNPNTIDPVLNKYSLEGIKVQGTFPSILRLLRSTRGCSRLISIDKVNLTSAQSQSQDSTSIGGSTAPAFMFGNGDTVVAEMNLTVYIYPMNGDKMRKVAIPGGDTGAGGGLTAPGSGLPGASSPGPPMPGGPRPGGPQMPGGPPMPGGPRPGGPPMG